MNIDTIEALWLGEAAVCHIEQLADASGLSLEEIEDLVDNGLITPVAAPPAPRTFHLVHVVTVRKARRLRDDFELDRNGVALALTLLRRIDRLESELRATRSRSAPK